MAGEHKVKSLGELPLSRELPRDLWPQIEARLQAPQPVQLPQRRGGLPMRRLAAAAMVASVALGVWIGRDMLPHADQSAVAPMTAATHTLPRAGTASPIDASYVSDPRYQHARAQLVQSLQAQLDAMPPAARAKVSASLATIEKAKMDLEQALGKDPSNALLQELLINTYQDEMRALTDVHEASDPGRGI